ncbi:response regulator [Acetobacterium woodii]|uniref:Stage 0 sporulation protein A homolog n=1 Tax=Acetobacterium woodii (strain ATCC 29683 / DSM 1030 / JCM 2381 / KCTC 1655 / WB1) TaxID=931626 RepID=H6LJ00_ACEWD|nr:response regulator transcription factor [Acetobacterium woodii]AFA47363.1 DNA-binding response regulator KdpE [Acetobacterium woodii DSM 1030]
MDNKSVILIVEDEMGIANFIAAILKANDYKMIKAVTGKEAISMAASYSPDLILLDLGLPDIDGMDVLKTIRVWSNIPIVVVSARGHEREKVEALDLGADDYITKPFGTAELLARIRTGIRHSPKNRGADTLAMSCLVIGDLTIDYDKRVVTVAEKAIHLTPIEYKIMVLLSKNIGKVLTHDTIIREVWGPYTNEIQALRVNMANIRRKIEENPAEPKYIVTQVGVGYRMVEE